MSTRPYLQTLGLTILELGLGEGFLPGLALEFRTKDLADAAKKGEGRSYQHLCIQQQKTNGRNLPLRNAIHHDRASTRILLLRDLRFSPASGCVTFENLTPWPRKTGTHGQLMMDIPSL